MSIEAKNTTPVETAAFGDVVGQSQGFIKFLAAVAVFAILFLVGVNNVWRTSARTNVLPAVLAKDTSDEEMTPSRKMLIVKMDGTSSNVNIRESPSQDSRKVGEAGRGEMFELNSENPDWYGVKLMDGSIGYISASYAEVIESLE